MPTVVAESRWHRLTVSPRAEVIRGRRCEVNLCRWRRATYCMALSWWKHSVPEGDSNADADHYSEREPMMKTGRLEAFSDGVIAIIITIMVLELKVPHGDTLEALLPLIPLLLSYVLSFVYVGIYWNNHHHMLHACDEVTGGILWANLHLLFWLSLIPFATAWLGENHFSSGPAALYGAVLLLCAIAYVILQQQIIKSQEGKRGILKQE